MGGKVGRFAKHGKNLAVGFYRKGGVGLGKAAAVAASQQGHHYLKNKHPEIGVKTAYLPRLVKAVTRGDLEAVVALALEAMGKQADHAASQHDHGEEGRSFMHDMSRRFALRLPKIFREYKKGGGDQAGAATLQALMEHASDVAQAPPHEQHTKLTGLSRRLRHGASKFAHNVGLTDRRQQRQQPALEALDG